LRIIDNTLNSCFSDTSVPQPKSKRPSQPLHSLGQFDKLPLELLSEVLLELDVPTLVAFRCVNRHAMTLVDSFPKFCRVVDNCATVIRAIVATKANSFTFNTLHNSLSMRDCVGCGRFGGYLYLITCERVCYFCFSRDTAYFPITESTARRIGITKNLLDQLPHLFSLPGQYTPFEKLSKKRIKLFDRVAMQQRAQDARWTAVTGRQIDYTTREPKRYMAIISAPHFCFGKDIDWGVHCLGCRDIDEPKRHLRIKYSQAAILDHFKQYGPVRQIRGRMQHVQ
jgi:F-box domain